MKLPPTMPITTAIRTSTTRISISVIPDCRVVSRPVMPAPLSGLFATAPRGQDPARGATIRHASLDKFAHPHYAEQDREHDPADQHREREQQRRLEHGEEALDREGHLAVVDVGDAAQ